jgi:hypothetical protein
MPLHPNPAFVEHLQKRAATARVPIGLRDGLVWYCAARRAPGSFLLAVLRNDLKDAVGRADEISSRHFAEILGFLYNYAPGPCWGSPEHVEAWLADPEPVTENYD